MKLACRHKVVVVEGNYLLLTDGEWKGLEDVFDERWYDQQKLVPTVCKTIVFYGIPAGRLVKVRYQL